MSTIDRNENVRDAMPERERQALVDSAIENAGHCALCRAES